MMWLPPDTPSDVSPGNPVTILQGRSNMESPARRGAGPPASASITQQTMWINRLQIIAGPSPRDPRHCGAEVSHGCGALFNSWPTAYRRITNGCFTALSFRVIYYTAKVRWVGDMSESLRYLILVRMGCKKDSLGDLEGRNEALCSLCALSLMCWHVGKWLPRDPCLLFWAHVQLSLGTEGQTSSAYLFTYRQQDPTQEGNQLVLDLFQLITLFSSWLPTL